jgi:hypothetical protein
MINGERHEGRRDNGGSRRCTCPERDDRPVAGEGLQQDRRCYRTQNAAERLSTPAFLRRRDGVWTW